MLLFDKVSKKFGSYLALDKISFKIEKGEFVFLVGPSGAGKTTILRLIIKDMVPDAGLIKLEDMDIAKLKPAEIPQLRRRVGMVFQDFKMLNDRTIFENVAVALEILGKSPSFIEEKVKEVLDLVGLAGKKNYFPLQLSAGELQRTSIARAIIGKPEVLLADEPTGNLDPKTGWEIVKVLNQVNKLGTTVIMATHNLDIVNSLNKRVIKINKGKLVKDELKGRYS